ncbi:MAG: mannose-1-phosphate guanylyltransferase/mannose-6-phosphate isomerase, partial [Alphaproteobacteria bacterium]
FYWNAGIFLARADALIGEFERHAPEILVGVRTAFAQRRSDPDFIRPDAWAWNRVESISIDYAIMERTEQAAVVPVTMGWSDVGSWDALHEALPRDEAGNAILGDVLAEDVADSLLRAEKGGAMIAALGVKDLVVVSTPDAVLVLPRERAQDVRRLVDRLKRADRPEVRVHPDLQQD